VTFASVVEEASRGGLDTTGEREGKQQMIAILALDATPRALRAVVHDPTVRLWIDLEYRDQPDARCVVDGRPVPALPRRGGPVEAGRRGARRGDARGSALGGVGRGRGAGGRPPAEVIDGALPEGLDSRTVAAVRAARARWPRVPHVACRAAGLDVEAEM